MSGGKFEFDDGGYYIGEWLAGQAHGKGICTGPGDRGKFAGLWSNGQEVSGVYNWPNGSHFHGDWKDGVRHGYGVEYHNGCAYYGEWLNGSKHGYGVTQTEPGKKVCYEGTWKFGVQDGYGVEIYSNGGFYVGQWKDGYRHGYGMRVFGISADDLAEGTVSLRQCLSQTSVELSSLNSRCDEDRATTEPDAAPHLREHASAVCKHTRSGKTSVLKRSQSSPCKVFRDMTGLYAALEVNMHLYEERASSMELRAVDDAQENSYAVERGSDETSLPLAGVSPSFLLNGADVYKGEWQSDRREGCGVCYYGDGGRYIGEWRDNKRHGYGLMVSREGHRRGGKWYNDGLLFMTQRKSVNLRLPVVKNKMRRAVVRGVESVELAGSKCRLAVARGLSARKIAALAKQAASAADFCAEGAAACEEKYTIHSPMEAAARNMSRESIASSISVASLSSKRSTCSLYSEPASPAPIRKLSMTEKARRKLSLSPLGHAFNLGVGEFDAKTRPRTKERALSAAVDTLLTAGAVDSTISQYVMINRNDTCPFRSRAVEKSTLARMISESGPSFIASLTCADVCVRQMGESEAGVRESGRREASSARSHTLRQHFLHPADFTDRSQGVVSPSPRVASGSFQANRADATPVVVSGKLLNGDEVDFNYVCLSKATGGQETWLLHTYDQRPRFLKNYAVSEEGQVLASTGLYRTISGPLPPVLTLKFNSFVPMVALSEKMSGAVDPENCEDASLCLKPYSPGMLAAIAEPPRIPAVVNGPTLEGNQLPETKQDEDVDRASLEYSSEDSADWTHEELESAFRKESRTEISSCDENYLEADMITCEIYGEPDEAPTDVVLARNPSREKPRSNTVLNCSNPERSSDKKKPFPERRRHTVNVVPRSSLKPVVVRCESVHSAVAGPRSTFSDASSVIKTRDIARDAIISAEENFMRETHAYCRHLGTSGSNSDMSTDVQNAPRSADGNVVCAGQTGPAKKRFLQLLARRGSGKSPNDLQSLSVDSGFKQSMSVDIPSRHPSPTSSNHDPARSSSALKKLSMERESSLESITSYEHVKFNVDHDMADVSFTRLKTLLKKAFRSSSTDSATSARAHFEAAACSLASVHNGSLLAREHGPLGPTSSTESACSGLAGEVFLGEGGSKTCGFATRSDSCGSSGGKTLKARCTILGDEAVSIF